MGSIASKEFEEMLEEDLPASPSLSGDVVLAEDFDPRSPTSGITRTPIHVLRPTKVLEDPRSPTVEIDRTPICLGKTKPVFETPLKSYDIPKRLVLDDPRSPTQGIDRTPICSEGKTKAMSAQHTVNSECDGDIEKIADPRSPSTIIARTPICAAKSQGSASSFDEISLENDLKDDKNDNDVLSEPIKMSLLEDQVNILNDPLESISIKDDSLVLTETETQSQKESETKKKPLVKKKQKPLVLQHTNTSTNDATFEDKKNTTRSPLKVLGDRSPFSSRKVDYNSPRAIVQRKQSGKLGIKKTSLQVKPQKGSSKYKTLEEDKENM